MTGQQIGALEIGAALVLCLHWLVTTGRRSSRILQTVAIAAGGWLGEEICVRWERAYQYAPGWHARLDEIPLAVLLIWPSVVLSARVLAHSVARDPLPRALWCGAITWLDASLVEPVATHAGLWSWNLPGPFGVAWVGPFGWGAYAFAAAWLLDTGRVALVPLAAPLAAQVLILAAHWGLGHWLPAPSPDLGLAAAALPGLLATATALQLRHRVRLPWGEAIARGAAASLFFGLLALHFDPRLALLTGAVAVPYLLLLPPPPSWPRTQPSGASTDAAPPAGGSAPQNFLK